VKPLVKRVTGVIATNGEAGHSFFIIVANTWMEYTGEKSTFLNGKKLTPEHGCSNF